MEPTPDDLLQEANNPALPFCQRVFACEQLVLLVNARKILPAILMQVNQDVYNGWRTGRCK
jgi:hypothetical protein